MTSINRTLRVLTLLSAITLCAMNLFASVVISSSSPLPSGTVSVPYSAALNAVGGTSPYQWSITSCSGSCNTGLGWSNSGVLFGTPVNAGTSTFGFKVTDAAGNTASTSLAITISSPSPSAIAASDHHATTLGVSTASLPTGTVSVPYSATLAATGGTSPYKWAITSCSGSCNTGLGWSNSGVLSGTPAHAGASTLGFKVTDAAGNTATKSLNVTIATSSTPITPPSTPVTVSVTPTSAAVSTGLTQQFSASVSGTTNTSVTWTVNGTQGGSSAVGTISAAGLYQAPASVPSGGTVTISVQCMADTTKTASATVSISAVPAPVSVSITPTSSSVTAGSTQQFSANVSGTTSTGITWQVNNVTGGNATVGTISSSGLYTAPSSVPSAGSVTVTAISSYDAAASASATVGIKAAATPPPSTTSSTWSGWNFTPTLYASASGSGTTCSSSSPCTLDYAFNTKAKAGSVIQAAPGTYNYGSGGYVSLNASGASGNPIVVYCATRGACVIESSTANNSGAGVILEMAGSYQGVYGFTFTSTQTSGVNVNQAIFMTGHDYTFAENTIFNINPDCSSNGGGGIQVANGVYNYTIDANLIYNIGNGNPACAGSSVVQVDGILAESTGAGAVITNNIVWGVYGGWGILYGNSSGNTAPGIIANNLVFNNANGGIAMVNGTEGSTVVNNITVDNKNNAGNGGCGIWTIYANLTGTQFLNNDDDGNSNTGGCSTSSIGAISASPTSTFVNWQLNGSGNYAETSGSPTIDAGTATGAPNHDFAGNPRPAGAGYDIGPYEYQ